MYFALLGIFLKEFKHKRCREFQNTPSHSRTEPIRPFSWKLRISHLHRENRLLHQTVFKQRKLLIRSIPECENTCYNKGLIGPKWGNLRKSAGCIALQETWILDHCIDWQNSHFYCSFWEMKPWSCNQRENDMYVCR